MIKIEHSLLERVSGEALASPRQRKNLNFHQEYSDPLQRMLNAIEPWSYIQPHKHEDPDKTEAFVVLRGRLLVIEFNDTGSIRDHALLDPLEGAYGAEIPPRTFHTIIALEPGTMVYEIKHGPYNPIDDKNFAPWAPREGNAHAIDYLVGLFQQLPEVSPPTLPINR